MAWTLPVYEKLQKLDAKIAELEKPLDGLHQGRLARSIATS